MSSRSAAPSASLYSPVQSSEGEREGVVRAVCTARETGAGAGAVNAVSRVRAIVNTSISAGRYAGAAGLRHDQHLLLLLLMLLCACEVRVLSCFFLIARGAKTSEMCFQNTPWSHSKRRGRSFYGCNIVPSAPGGVYSHFYGKPYYRVSALLIPSGNHDLDRGDHLDRTRQHVQIILL